MAAGIVVTFATVVSAVDVTPVVGTDGTEGVISDTIFEVMVLTWPEDVVVMVSISVKVTTSVE